MPGCGRKQNPPSHCGEMSVEHNGDGLSVRARAFSVSQLIASHDEWSSKSKSSMLPSTSSATNCHSTGSCKSEEDRSTQTVTAELIGRELWQEFHALGTEMIITKTGRRVFPSLKIRLSGLEEDVYYIVYVDIDPADDKRYRYLYQSSKWVPGGPGDVPHQNRRFLHPDGPQLGSYWNSQSCIAFDRLKLTNRRQPHHWELIPLHSMHRYQPKFYVQPVTFKGEEYSSIDTWRKACRSSLAIASATFPETQFITVTAYQNQQITRLKIASNPFAKGFRDSGNRDTDEKDEPHSKRIRSFATLNDQFSCLERWNYQRYSANSLSIQWWIQQFAHLQPLFPSSNQQST